MFKREGKESNQMKNTNKRYRIKSPFRFIMFVVIILGLAAGTFGYIT